METRLVDRRRFLALTVAGVARAAAASPQVRVTRPEVSESACPLETITPVARDGYRGQAVLRKPPGAGPFPVIIWIHPGIVTFSLSELQSIARAAANPVRFLAAGYVVVVPTYRSRDVDPQTRVSLEDCLAVVKHVATLPYVDRDSVVVYGCSGGGDLALELAAATRIAAVVPEEPASMLMAGMFNASIPKRGERYTPEDGFFLMDDPTRYYTPQYQRILRGKVAKISCPILIIQGDVDRRILPINRYNAEILLPDLQAAKKNVTVKTYGGQFHCFCFRGYRVAAPAPNAPPVPTSWPVAALEAFRDIDQFCRPHLRTQPRELNAKLVTAVEIGDL